MSLGNVSERMRADWDRRIGQDYRFWMSDGYKSDQAMWDAGFRDYKLLLQDYITKPGQVLLDIGCGVGRLIKPALSDFSRVIGIDISKEAIKRAAELLENPFNLELKLGSGLGLDGVPAHCADMVISFATLGSIPTDIVARYLVEIHRVLKTDGEVRLQMYLGTPQEVANEDTLYIRCYESERARLAFSQAGFEVRWIRELNLPFQASSKELGIQAVIVALKKLDVAVQSSDLISRTLLPNGELATKGPTLGQDLEYLMSINYAKELAATGEIERAKQILQFAISSSTNVTENAHELLANILKQGPKIASEIETKSPDKVQFSSDSFIESNLKVIYDLFPQVYSLIDNNSLDFSSLSFIETKDGPVISDKGNNLDHPSKPVLAAEKWALQVFNRITSETKALTIVGCGCGYHIESIIKERERRNLSFKINVIEPGVATFKYSLQQRDARGWLAKISSMQIGSSATIPADTEILEVRAQVAALYPEQSEKLRCSFYGQAGLSLLHPSIGVVGPFHGGTLPMMKYVTLTLQLMNQRARAIDVSCFDSGYAQLESFVKDKHRRSPVENMYYEMVSQIVLESVNEKPVDILFCMALAPISPRVLTELRSRGIITVLWFVEDYQRFTFWKQLAPYFDFIFTIQKGKCIEALKAAGAAEVHYIPVACEPNVHAPLVLSPEEKAQWGSPVSFMGAGYHNRQQLFASLAEFPLKIWGTEWPEVKPFDRMVQDNGKRLSPAEYVKVFNSTDINLNLHSSSERDGVDPFGDFINPRTFELASAGAFQLVDDRQLLSEMFDVGKEIITFSSGPDLKDKIRYYLNNKEERLAIAQKSRARVLKEHTYAHRIKEMLSIVYARRYEQLKARQDDSAWSKMLRRSAKHEELHQRCQKAFNRGEQPNLDGLISDIITGQGKLSDTEKKLLFLFHLRKQIVRHAQQDAGEG